jgi:hypothetical protein
MMVDPISTTVKAVEERLTSLEAKVASLTEQLTSRPSRDHELCVANDGRARTCISKAQLDRLLAALAEPAEAAQEPSAPQTKAAAVEEPAKIETTTAVEAPRQGEQAAAETLDPDFMPTGSIPAPESQGRAVVTYPKVEITTPPIEN